MRDRARINYVQNSDKAGGFVERITLAFTLIVMTLAIVFNALSIRNLTETIYILMMR